MVPKGIRSVVGWFPSLIDELSFVIISLLRMNVSSHNTSVFNCMHAQLYIGIKC